MKKFRKLFAVLTASALVGAMSFTTMAASIKINHDDTYDGTAAQKYQAYKILDVIKDDSTKGNTTDDTVGKTSSESGIAYSIASDSEWLSVLQDKDQKWLDCKPSADGSKYVITLKADNKEETAKDMAKYFKDHMPEGAAFTTLTADEAKTPVDDGYYLITSTLGTNLILATSDIEITEKNDYPKDDKKVETASITAGQNATYYITVVVPKSIDTSKAIKVHDKLPAELSFNEDVKVYVADTTDKLNASTPVDTLKNFKYSTLRTDTVVTKNDSHNSLGDGCALHIDITPTNYVGQTLVFQYSAKLLETAAADHGFVNREFLNYSEYQTTNKDVPVMTYDFGLTKTFAGSTDKDSSLTATFKLYDAKNYDKLKTGGANAMKFKTDGTGYYVSTETDATSDITAVDDTELNVRGLGAGTYYLVETATANGYNVLDHAISITVTATYDETTGHVNGGRVSIKNGKAESNDKVSVENVKGLLLPSTGGMGTVAFAVVGLIVMAGAAVTLIIKKRA